METIRDRIKQAFRESVKEILEADINIEDMENIEETLHSLGADEIDTLSILSEVEIALTGKSGNQSIDEALQRKVEYAKAQGEEIVGISISIDEARKAMRGTWEIDLAVAAELNHRLIKRVIDFLEEKMIQSIEAKKRANGEMEPRMHHYTFAHKMLPYGVFNDTQKTVSNLLEDEGVEFLYDLWATVGKKMKESHNSEILSPTGLAYEYGEIRGLIFIILQFPEPIFYPEAYYAAIICNRSLSYIRYITCETTLDNRAVIGEWTKKGNHLNHSEIPIPNGQEFLEHTVDLVRMDIQS